MRHLNSHHTGTVFGLLLALIGIQAVFGMAENGLNFSGFFSSRRVSL